MTSLLLLLAAAPPVAALQGEPAYVGPTISEAQAIAKAKAKAAALKIRLYGEPTATSIERDYDRIWRVNLTPALSRPSTTMDLEGLDGHLVAFSDHGFSATPAMPGWSPRLPRLTARGRTVTYGRTLGVPANWTVGRTSFDGTGKNRWPARAEVTFVERPLGYPFLVEGNTATVTLNPRTGALTNYVLTDTFTEQQAAVRFRPDQASRIARDWRRKNRTDIRPTVQGPIRLGWAFTEQDSNVARLVYDVPFRIETHWVDANTGKIVGGRRTKAVAPIVR